MLMSISKNRIRWHIHNKKKNKQGDVDGSPKFISRTGQNND